MVRDARFCPHGAETDGMGEKYAPESRFRLFGQCRNESGSILLGKPAARCGYDVGTDRNAKSDIAICERMLVGDSARPDHSDSHMSWLIIIRVV